MKLLAKLKLLIFYPYTCHMCDLFLVSRCSFRHYQEISEGGFQIPDAVRLIPRWQPACFSVFL